MKCCGYVGKLSEDFVFSQINPITEKIHRFEQFHYFSIMPYLKYNLIFIYTNPILSLEYYFREGEFMFKSLLNMHHTKIYTSAE